MSRRSARPGALGGAAIALTACAVIACAGTAGRRASSASSYDGFACNERRAEYLLVGSFAAAEIGLAVSCEGNQPQLEEWFVEDGSVVRDANTYAIAPAEFETLWQQLEDGGWRNLEDCLASAAEGDQVATFDITDGDSRVSLTCQGKTQPFPFDRMANAFEALGRNYGSR